MIKHTEESIANILAFNMFKRQYFMFIPNCNYTGHECDILAVTPDFRIIDIEIKISKADLKADVKKKKWYETLDWEEVYKLPWEERKDFIKTFYSKRKKVTIPDKVWKHYYAMPVELWDSCLYENISPDSGVLLIKGNNVIVERKAKCNKNVNRLTEHQVYDLARLTCLRLWTKKGVKNE